jgi:hypothetical protein
LILRRIGRYCAVFARKFNQAPIWARSTRGVSMMVNKFVDANVARDSFLGMVMFGARMLCT